jgi:hypothetical protein
MRPAQSQTRARQAAERALSPSCICKFSERALVLGRRLDAPSSSAAVGASGPAEDWIWASFIKVPKGTCSTVVFCTNIAGSAVCGLCPRRAAAPMPWGILLHNALRRDNAAWEARPAIDHKSKPSNQQFNPNPTLLTQKGKEPGQQHKEAAKMATCHCALFQQRNRHSDGALLPGAKGEKGPRDHWLPLCPPSPSAQ